MFKKIKSLARNTDNIDLKLNLIVQNLQLQQIEKIRSSEKYRDPKSLIPYGKKVYSQNDEDGIIREIFRRIGTTNKIFVEFGVGTGLENNTYALLFDNWSGLWIEGSSKWTRKIEQNFESIIKSGQLSVINAMITKDNIDGLISSCIKEKEIDLLTIDIDGNDYHVYSEIKCINPRVLVFEYNAKFIPTISYCMDYDENHIWKHDDCFGSSLYFLETELLKKGYNLVGCNITGANAFFVRKDLISDKFAAPYTAEQHYEPARPFLSEYISGHPSSYKTLIRKYTQS